MLTLFSDATTNPILGCTSKKAVTVAAAVSVIPIPLGITALVDATMSVMASAVGKLRLTDNDRMENISHSLAMLTKVMLAWTKCKIRKCTFDVFTCQAKYVLESNVAADIVNAKILYSPVVIVTKSIEPTVNQTSMPIIWMNVLL